jgi:dihydrofolate reductase
VVGRKLFDSTGGWRRRHPMDRPVVVVIDSVPESWPREDAPFTFVTDGIAAAIDKAKIAGGGQGGRDQRRHHCLQCLNAGLLDEMWVDLVPVLLGGGTLFFDQLKAASVELESPISAVQGSDVTHLRYRVRYR